METNENLDVSNKQFEYGLCPVCHADWDNGLVIHNNRKRAEFGVKDCEHYKGKTDEELEDIRLKELDDLCAYLRDNNINNSVTPSSFSERISNLRGLVLGVFSKETKDGYICPFCRSAWFQDTGVLLTKEERDYYKIHYV